MSKTLFCTETLKMDNVINLINVGRNIEIWKESHRAFCSEEFVQAHTKERQKQYIEKEMECGKGYCLFRISLESQSMI